MLCDNTLLLLLVTRKIFIYDLFKFIGWFKVIYLKEVTFQCMLLTPTVLAILLNLNGKGMRDSQKRLSAIGDYEISLQQLLKLAGPCPWREWKVQTQIYSSLHNSACSSWFICSKWRLCAETKISFSHRPKCFSLRQTGLMQCLYKGDNWLLLHRSVFAH